MATPGEKRDPIREELTSLRRRLLIEAVKLFRQRKCFGPDAVFPGGGTVEDIVQDTLANLIIEERWVPGSGEDRFPLAVTMMRHDFLDRIKRKEFRITESKDPKDMEQQIAGTVFSLEQVDARIRLDSFKRFLDSIELAYIEARLRGFIKTDEIALEMKITEQEVKNIKRRLTYKINKLEERSWRNKDQ
jgi:DNA-directed RNA polymerase specialized sigma24 family protein